MACAGSRGKSVSGESLDMEETIRILTCRVRRHWSLDMIQLHTFINSRHATAQPSSSSPLRLLLHLKPPEPKSSTGTPSIPLSNSVDSCRIAFISLLKEADYIRWGNTRRITGLRRADLEGAWNGIVEGMCLPPMHSQGTDKRHGLDNYEVHSRFVNKIVPLPLPAPSSSSTYSSNQTQPPENLGVSGPDSCFTVRSIPLKLYLPHNAPEVQDIVNPLNGQGRLLLATYLKKVADDFVQEHQRQYYKCLTRHCLCCSRIRIHQTTLMRSQHRFCIACLFQQRLKLHGWRRVLRRRTDG